MVTIRVTSFLLGLMIFLVAVRDSIADSHHGLEKIPVAGVNPSPVMGRVPVTLDEENFDNDVPASEVKSTRLGGRKMMLKSALDKEREETAHFVGNCKHKGKGLMLNVEGKFSNRSLHHPAVKVRIGGFIAFSADYHVPKPHPPKNN